MHILSIVRGEFFSLHRTLKCKYSKKWSRHKLENGETQVQACSIRDYSSVISQKLNKIQQFAQKYNRHVGWRQKDVSTKVGTTNAATKGKRNWTPAEQAAWVRRPIRSLEVQLAGASENLELDQKLKEKLKRLKTQKLQNLMTLNYTRGKLIDYMRKGWAKTDLSRKYHSRECLTEQWGFQVGRLTVTALVTVTHEWLKVLECRQDACSVFFDLKNQKRLILSPINF